MSGTHLFARERVPLLELLLVLVLVDQDEVDAPHAVVEVQRVGLVVEVHLRAEGGRVGLQLHTLELVQLFVHQVVHDVRPAGRRGEVGDKNSSLSLTTRRLI